MRYFNKAVSLDILGVDMISKAIEYEEVRDVDLDDHTIGKISDDEELVEDDELDDEISE